MKYTYRLRGKRAQTEGKWFEEWLGNAARRSGWVVFHIPQGCEFKGPGKIIAKRTPFDYVFVSKGVVIFADAKSFDNDRITKSMIKAHQVEAMSLAVRSGIPAGYIIYFRKIQEYRFFSACDLLDLRPRTSLKNTDGIFLGRGHHLDLWKIINGTTKEETPDARTAS